MTPQQIADEMTALLANPANDTLSLSEIKRLAIENLNAANPIP